MHAYFTCSKTETSYGTHPVSGQTQDLGAFPVFGSPGFDAKGPLFQTVTN